MKSGTIRKECRRISRKQESSTLHGERVVGRKGNLVQKRFELRFRTEAVKGAIIAYTRSLAVEFAYKGIRVNAITPGWITVKNYFSERRLKAIPVARCGEPSDIPKLAAFLCSDDVSFIVGQTIVSDGGTTALMSLVSDFRKESAQVLAKVVSQA